MRRAGDKPKADIGAWNLVAYDGGGICRLYNRLSVFMPSDVATGSGGQSLEELRRELAEAREQQAATGEILRIISSFQKDTQPVLDAIVTASKRLLRSHSALVSIVAGDELRLAAFTSTGRAADEELRRFFPLKLVGVSP